MYVERFRLEGSGATGRDFVVAGRSKPELFSARLLDRSDTLEVAWTASLSLRTLASRLLDSEISKHGSQRTAILAVRCRGA